MSARRYTVVLWSIVFQAETADLDSLLLELWERGVAGIVEEATGLRAFFHDDVLPAAVIAAIPHSQPDSIRAEPGTHAPPDQADCDAILAGERFFITQPGNSHPCPPSRLRLELSTSTAFGTGRHETTQLCLQALERHLRPEHVVLDIGCGSGILSAAARLLGAHRIFSCDIHEDAIAAARRLLGSPVFAGSADAIASASADFVIANISASVLEILAPDLRRVIKPSGLLVLSGFIKAKPPQYCRPEEILEQGDWLCWICRPEGIRPPVPLTLDEGLSHNFDWWL